jgi:hypothetical protein
MKSALLYTALLSIGTLGMNAQDSSPMDRHIPIGRAVLVDGPSTVSASVASAAPAPAPAAGPAAQTPEQSAKIRRDVIAAVEQVLALHGNPPFAELVTNDQTLVAALRQRLDAVRDRDRLERETQELATRKAALIAELAQKEKELTYAREQVALLSGTIARVSGEMKRIQESMATQATVAPAAVAPAATP